MNDLNDLIREVMDDRELADPYVLVPFVLERISDDDLRAALALCLSTQIQRVIRSRRSAAYRRTPTLDEQTRLAEVVPGRWIDSVQTWLLEAQASGLLDQRVCVGREWKFVGDCTSLELREVAAKNRLEAVANWRRAAFYEQLADTLDQHSFTTLRDASAVPV